MITFKGKETEKLVCKLTGATREGVKDKDGDVMLTAPDGSEILVEVKKHTLNQTRVSKYIPLVSPIPVREEYIDKNGKKKTRIAGWKEPFWHVMSSVDQIKECFLKDPKGGRTMKKGQHTPNCMSVVGLGGSDKLTYGKTVTSDELKDAIIEAYREGQQNQAALAYASRCRAEEERLCEMVDTWGSELRDKLFD
jgi:hypothetical protein